MIRTLEKWWSAFDGINFALGGNKPDVETAKKIVRSVLDAGNPDGNTVYRIARDTHEMVDIVDCTESVENFFNCFYFGHGEFKWDTAKRGMNGRENYGEFRDKKTGARLFYAVPHTVARY